MITAQKGTKDIYGDEVAKWHFVERAMYEVFENANYNEIRTPIFEATELFARGVGDTTDIVNKEMYTFEKSDRSLTLRPENTAGVVRSFIENGMHRLPAPVKLWYKGQMFRYERPQAGRQRQFHQVGVEIFAPLYPLAPKHTCEESFAFLPDYWEHLSEEQGCTLLMGDSAGGGLAVSFCQYLQREQKKLPEALILYSPWLDVSLSDPDCEQYQDSDPVLDIQGLRTCGKIWAGKYDTKDERVSPIFGKTDFLPPVLLFSGTKELFYPQISKFSDRLTCEGVDATLVLGEDLFHDYAMYPIPEGKETIVTVRNWLENRSLIA